MSDNITIITQLRKSKKMDGISMIYIRVTYKKKRFEFSTNQQIETNSWDPINKVVIDNHKVNLNISRSISKVYTSIAELESEEEFFTNDQLKNRILGITKSVSLLGIIETHNNEMNDLIPKKYSKGTLKNYKVMFNHIKNFLDDNNLEDIELKHVNQKWIKSFEFYLLKHTQCTNNGAIKYLQMLKKIINISYVNGQIKKNPFEGIKFTKKPFQRGYLNIQELNKIEKIKLSDSLDRIRDLFVFSCYTGLSYIDVTNLKEDDIIIGEDGLKWIIIKRGKTQTLCKIPLLNKAESIIEKHLGNYPERVFKKISNQKLNQYLKEIAQKCNIEKNITFHLARHTFATTITLNNNVPIETVSKVLGHKKIATTQIYAKILDKKISSDIRKLEL